MICTALPSISAWATARKKTRNPVMAAVGDRMRAAYALLQEKNVSCTLEWNSGGHFQQPDCRTAKAFAWVLEHLFY